MQRRSSTGSFRTSSFRVENRSLTERQRHSSFTDDTLTEFRKTCRLCSDLINAGMVIVAEGHSWHVECFVCSNCLATLSDYHEHEGKLLCKKCIIQLVGGCAVCRECLGPSYVIANDNKYHTECFRCSQCSLPLGTNENYTLCGESQIICDNCHQSNILSLISGDKCVQLKWGDITTELSDDCTLRITGTNDYSPVRRNDIIMTINGTFVSDVSLQDISPSATVTLTVSNNVSRSRNTSETSPPPTVSPPSPPPPFSRSHNRRLNKSLSASPPPPEPYSSSYIFKPCMVEVGEVIGQGFYGRVRRAKLTRTGEIVCLKELQNVMDPVSAKLFVDEVALLKNLRHVNVLTFKGIVTNPPNFSLLTEYVDGGTLRKLIKRLEIIIPWTKRLKIALDVSSGMSYLHSKEIIHRDLTSKNCLLRSDGSVVVADFGLAQYHHTSSHYNTSYLSPPIAPGKRRNHSVGGFYWRAPEMIQDKPYDSKVDIFSYGIVMCELIARIKADPDILPRKSTDWGLDEAKFRKLVPDDCPDPFLSVILQCCCPSPEHRPPFSKICDFIVKLCTSSSPSDYSEILSSITRTLHSIIEDD